MLREASGQSRSFFETYVHNRWERSYRAFNNEHFAGSLYLQDAYRNRSKIFKPKTRSAVRKRQATRAKALFTTGDVVSVMAENDSDPRQVAGAALKQEILNYRLGTSTHRNGIPWFLTAMGAGFDADLSGMCCSKQFWLFEERDTGEDEIVPQDDPKTGERKLVSRPKMLTIVDRPEAQLIPPENVRFDPNCNWTNVAQLSPYLLLQFPMTADEVLDMIERNKRSRTPWLPITREEIARHAGGDLPSETVSPRSARTMGSDPVQQASGAYKPLWLTECFFRHEGRDWMFWAIKDSHILSTPVPTEEVYPWLAGERPVTLGMGQLEPHRTYRMSAVESWQQLQAEHNDLANLRLDHAKQIVAPPTKVRRGAKVDYAQVQRKAQNSILLVNDMADIMPMELPDTPGTLFNESSLIAADFDDLAGNFDSASVQTNRDMNETVGGMHLLSESTNQVSDFDLSVWAETWVQPTIVQLLKLEEYYETDETVLSIAGQRASLWEKFGVGEITDHLLQSECTVRVNVGVGATSLPMEKVKKLSVAWDTVGKILAPFVQTGKVEVDVNAEAIATMVFGAAGFKDAGAGLFNYIGPPRQPAQPPPPDPKLQTAQINAQVKQQATQAQVEKNRGQMLISAHKLRADALAQHMQLQNDAANRATGVDIEHMKAMAEMERNARATEAAAAMAGRQHAHAHISGNHDAFLKTLSAHLMTQPAASGGEGAAKIANSPHGDPSRPMLAPKPSPHAQPQPGLYANV